MFFSDVSMVRGYERPHDGDAADYQEFGALGYAYGADPYAAGVAYDAQGNVLDAAGNILGNALDAQGRSRLENKSGVSAKTMLAWAVGGYFVARWLKLI